MGVTQVQGKSVPTFGYEMLRIIGFPAIVESHLTIGGSYKITDDMSIHLAYMHAFENTISETSAGGPMAVTLASDLEEDTYSFSLAWAF
jgi:long-chain fatty acid transport protein